MKIIMIIFIVSNFIISGCNKEVHFLEPCCDVSNMKEAYYEHSTDTSNIMLNLENKFLIMYDTANKANDFVSWTEGYYRERAIDIDSSWISHRDEWRLATENQKKKLLKDEMKRFKRDADSIHRTNNFRKIVVWIFNNSRDTINIQMQDWMYICILEGMYNGVWGPLEYWHLSKCGNSYHIKSFYPHSANAFVADIYDHGNYTTRLRYKLLGENQFYYSNEFVGIVDSCRFKTPSNNRYYMLDSLRNFVL